MEIHKITTGGIIVKECSISKNEIKRAFYNWKFFLVIMFETAFIFMFTMEKVMPVYRELYPAMLSDAFTGKNNAYIPGALYQWLGFSLGRYITIIFAVLPLLAAIPYGASLYMEENNRYCNQVILRGGKKPYYRGKLLGMFFSGGVVAVYPFLLSLLVNMALLPIEHVSATTHEFRSNNAAFIDVFYEHTGVYLLIYFMELFILFGLLNCCCFIATYIFSNRFVVMSFPFAIYFTSGVLGQTTGINAVPWIYSRMQNMQKETVIPAMIQIILVIICTVGMCIYKSSRRVDTL